MTKPLGFSYIRFSSPKQAEGDSLRRQTTDASAWCKRNDVVLDTTWTLHDLGKSAFKGNHRANPDRNALAAFLKLVEDGKIPHGSYLIVESLDRLTREHIRPALTLLLNLIEAGVRVVQLKPVEVIYDEDVEPMTLMMALMELSRGHSESAVKSNRVGEAWRQKKARAINGEALTARGPSWLRLVEGRWQVVEEAAATVKRIFEMAVAGHGIGRIVKRLNADGVPTLSTAKSRATYWANSSVAKILNNRAVVGEYQPYSGRAGNRKPIGSPIPAYYPRVVDDGTWFAVRAALASRKNKVGRIGEATINLFSHLLFDARNGAPLHIANKGEGNGGRLLISYSAKRGIAYGASFPLASFEDAILEKFREIDVREILPKKDTNDDKVLSLTGRKQDVRNQIDKIKAKLLNGGDSDALADVVRTLEAQEKTLAEELKEAQQEAATPVRQAWDNAKTLIEALDNAEDVDDMRMRLRAAFRRIIEGIYVLVVPGRPAQKPAKKATKKTVVGRDRIAVVQIWFADNKHRDYIILHKPALGGSAARFAGGPRPAQCWTESFISSSVKSLDLREPDHVKRLEQELLTTTAVPSEPIG